MRGAPHGTARFAMPLVLFGATGICAISEDLSRRSITWCAADCSHVPVIGVARAGWNLEQLAGARARQHQGLRQGRRTRRCSRGWSACCATSTATTATARPSTRCARRSGDCAAAAATTSRFRRACSRWSIEHLGATGPRAGRARRRREALRPRSRLGAGAQPDAARSTSPRASIFRIDHYLGKEAGAEPAVLPLRQLLPRAGLEPQLRRQRADHDGREARRRRAAASSTRRPARSATSCRTTCCRSWRC